MLAKGALKLGWGWVGERGRGKLDDVIPSPSLTFDTPNPTPKLSTEAALPV